MLYCCSNYSMSGWFFKTIFMKINCLKSSEEKKNPASFYANLQILGNNNHIRQGSRKNFQGGSNLRLETPEY